MQHLHLVGEVRTSCVSCSIQIISGLIVVGAHFTVFTLNALRTLAVMEPQVGQRA